MYCNYVCIIIMYVLYSRLWSVMIGIRENDFSFYDALLTSVQTSRRSGRLLSELPTTLGQRGVSVFFVVLRHTFAALDQSS